MEKPIKLIVLIAIVTLSVGAFRKVQTTSYKLEFNKIEIKSVNAKLKQLNENYDNLLDQKKVDKEKLKKLEKEKQELEKQLQAKREARAKTIASINNAVVADSQTPTSHQDLMRAVGIPESDWWIVDFIISKESGWNHLVWNGGGSGAYGLCQSLPATKMASAGADYMTNPVTQMKWCHNYAIERYGSWGAAYNWWVKNAWW